MFNLRRNTSLYERGAVLIMTMMAICLTFMMVTVLLNTSGAGLHVTSSFYDQEAALQAAQSGIDYAVTRLQKDKKWRGDGGGCGAENSPVFVKEDHGNVVGLLKDKGGHITAFRIKFNFEKAGIDKEKIPCNIFADPTGKAIIPSLGINMPYVSVNNLSRPEAAKVYRANQDGEGLSETAIANWEFFGSDADSDASRSFANYVPPQRVYLVAEGLAGKGLRDCTSPDDVKAAVTSNPVARRYVETYYSFNPPLFNGSAAFANGDLSMIVANKLFVRSTGYEEGKQTLFAAVAEHNAKKNGPGQLCSNGTISLEQVGELQTYHGKLLSPNPIDVSKIKVAPGDRPTSESATGTIDTVSWDDLAHVSDENKSACKLLAGFYQWDTVTKNGKTFYELRYYDQLPTNEASYVDAYGQNLKLPVPDTGAAYKKVSAAKVSDGNSEFINVGPEGKIAFETDDEGNITSPVLKLNGELYCDGDLMICSNIDHISETAPKVVFGSFKEADKNDQEAVLMGDGKITLLSSVMGMGAIVAKDDVSLVGSSIIDSGNGSVAIYSDKDVIINGFDTIIKKDAADWGQNYTVSSGTNPNAPPKPVTPDASSLYTDLINGVDDKNQFIKDYFSNLGVYVTEVSVEEKTRPPYYGWGENYEGYQTYFEIDFRFVDPSNEGCKSDRLVMTLNPWEGEPPCAAGFKAKDYPIAWNTAINVPGYAYGESNPYLNELERSFGSIVYGDTVINGIIYAKRDFKANLGDKFKLIVNGAIRAETGDINAACSYADLTYNEAYMQRLTPKYSKLSRIMWNCW